MTPGGTINYQAVEEAIKADYREITPKYRRDDEIEVNTPNHRRLTTRLREICESFPRPVRALEAGCGTGRYFHCLTNVSKLVGMDITEEMLRAAENPVLREGISVPEIQLICGNVYLFDFPPGSFDFIYSLGMFGNGCPATLEVCDKFHNWLAPGGKLLFNIVDTRGLPLPYRARRRVRRWLYPLLPGAWTRKLDERELQHPFFALNKRELAAILAKSRFSEFQIESHRCESPLWTGRHLECVAAKG